MLTWKINMRCEINTRPFQKPIFGRREMLELVLALNERVLPSEKRCSENLLKVQLWRLLMQERLAKVLASACSIVLGIAGVGYGQLCG